MPPLPQHVAANQMAISQAQTTSPTPLDCVVRVLPWALSAVFCFLYFSRNVVAIQILKSKRTLAWVVKSHLENTKPSEREERRHWLLRTIYGFHLTDNREDSKSRHLRNVKSTVRIMSGAFGMEELGDGESATSSNVWVAGVMKKPQSTFTGASVRCEAEGPVQRPSPAHIISTPS